jgi:ABC-2 type transport system ATP-binding protein
VELEIRDLTRMYGQKGLRPISFDVAQGELIAVIGHNGAGKSTLLKMLANWILPDGGSASIQGIDLRDRAAVVTKVGFVPEDPNLFDAFSVEYNLTFFARLSNAPSARVEEILHTFSLLPFRKTKVQVLSKGLKQRVNIGRALLTDPPVLLFDEPTTGLDFEMTQEIYSLLQEMREAGKTILFTSHRPEEIKSLATRMMVLHEGGLVFDGSPAEYFASQVHEKLYA